MPRVGPPARLQLSQAWLACLLAATGQDGETNALLAEIHGGGPLLSTEGAALTAVAEALLHIEDPDAVRSLLESAEVPDRPVRSSLWRQALLRALSPVGAPTTPIPEMPGFDRAFAAGAAGQRALAGGPLAEARPPPLPPGTMVCREPGVDDGEPLRHRHRAARPPGRRAPCLAARPASRTVPSLGRRHSCAAAPGRRRPLA